MDDLGLFAIYGDMIVWSESDDRLTSAMFGLSKRVLPLSVYCKNDK